MKIPWPVHAGAAAQGLPVLAAVFHRGLTPAQRWTVAWAGLLLAFDAATLWLALLDRNNHLLNYLLTPLAISLALWILSLWQTSSRATRVVRLLIPLLILVWTIMVLGIESTRTFSLLAEPFAGLLLLSGALWTLLTRAIHEEGSLTRQDWLWIAAGMALYAATSVALPPVASILVSISPDRVIHAYVGKSLVDVLAFALIARGVLCSNPLPLPFSA